MSLQAENVFVSANTGSKDRYIQERQKEVQKMEKGRNGFTTGADKKEAGPNDWEERGRTVEW